VRGAVGRPGRGLGAFAMSVVVLIMAGPVVVTPSTASARGAAARSTRPNILLIVTDDQTMATYSRDIDPAVYSQLVDKGVQFTRGYVSTSLCCPSRSEIMTGLYEHHTGVDANDVRMLRPTIVQALHDIGYRTMLSGKYLNSEPCLPRPEFDRWVCSASAVSALDPTLNIDGTVVQLKGYSTEIEANFVKDFITHTTKTTPFFAMYTPTSPHLPADDPRYDSLDVEPLRDAGYDQETRNGLMPQYMQRDPIDPTFGEVIDRNHMNMEQTMRALDDDIGSLLASLGSREQNTLVFFLSDNGYLYGEHRRAEKSVPYEESVRVPFVIRYPKLVPESQPFVSSALVENVDIAPTIADVLGIHWGADGTSLVPLLRKRTTRIRTGALIQHCEGETFPCYDPVVVPSFAGVVTTQYAYIDYVTGERELYDLTADPAELVNLAGDPGYGSVVAQLSSKLAGLRAPPPTDTTIVTGPQGVAASRAASFAYFSQSRLARYQCRLDVDGSQGVWAPCDEQPAVLGPLPDGDYVFEVEGTDENGLTDPTPDTRSFSIHLTGPEVQLTSEPPSAQKSGDASFAFTSGGQAESYDCALALYPAAEAWTPCSEEGVSYTGLADGLWNFEVRGKDGSGVYTTPPAQWLFRVDNAGPGVKFDSAPDVVTRSKSASFEFRPDEPATAMTCQVDTRPAKDCSAGTFDLVNVKEGAHTLTVTATDVLGNAAPTTFNWTVDVTPPALQVLSAPPPFWNQDSASIALSQDEGTNFSCSLDGAPSIICQETPAFYALADGDHTVTIEALDAAGNRSLPDVVAWTQDTVAPTVAIDAGPADPNNLTSATFEFSSDDPTATFACSLDGAEAVPCASPVTYDGLAEGGHSFAVTATDRAGNGGSASASWTVDLTAPVVTIEAGPTDPTTQTSATFEFSSDDPTATFACSLDGAEAVPCASPVTYEDLPVGDHSFAVTATDEAGNTGAPGTWAWTIEGVGRPGRRPAR
jgi:arylsulfatase A-like enzyme